MSESPVAELSFEEAIRALEQVVARLESGDVPLEESITLYDRGAQLRAHCEAKLRAAQEKVEQIVRDAEGPSSWSRARGCTE
ncbi:MAG: exodeoxyribonuclease VII small subunit [Alphaproteobacteria bacterium HGW-Alphaproteobacteria-2]|nr:MAG: exodeoxyribonuclease VII small subunit [Alphaproteobacteria bacterium HGW-Alphaproteobacteria-2]